MTSTLRITFAIAVGLALAGTGCAPSQNGAAGAPVNKSSGQTNSEAQSDLGFLNFAFTQPVYGKAPERLPDDLRAAATSIKVIDERIFERVDRGLYVIRWGAPFSDPVLAYEKQAPTDGGWVLRGSGAVERMTADQLNGLLGQKGN